MRARRVRGRVSREVSVSAEVDWRVAKETNEQKEHHRGGLEVPSSELLGRRSVSKERDCGHPSKAGTSPPVL